MSMRQSNQIYTLIIASAKIACAWFKKIPNFDCRCGLHSPVLGLLFGSLAPFQAQRPSMQVRYSPLEPNLAFVVTRQVGISHTTYRRYFLGQTRHTGQLVLSGQVVPRRVVAGSSLKLPILIRGRSTPERRQLQPRMNPCDHTVWLHENVYRIMHA